MLEPGNERSNEYVRLCDMACDYEIKVLLGREVLNAFLSRTFLCESQEAQVCCDSEFHLLLRSSDRLLL